MANEPVTVEQVLSSVVNSLGVKNIAQGLVDLETQVQNLVSLNQSAAQIVSARAANPMNAVGGVGDSIASGALDQVRSLFGRFTGVSPLVSGLVSLFSGGSNSGTPVAALPKFSLPSAVNLVAGQSSTDPSSQFGVDVAQGNSPRPIVNNSPQIVVQVQALDSKSLMDRSHDIALAVRSAMLDSGILTDVIREA